MHKLYLKRNNNYFSLRNQIKLLAFLVSLTIPFFILFLYKIFLNCFISIMNFSLKKTLNSKCIKNKVKEKSYQKFFIIFVNVIKLLHKLYKHLLSFCSKAIKSKNSFFNQINLYFKKPYKFYFN